jgi:hypothetical protein
MVGAKGDRSVGEEEEIEGESKGEYRFRVSAKREQPFLL